LGIMVELAAEAHTAARPPARAAVPVVVLRAPYAPDLLRRYPARAAALLAAAERRYGRGVLAAADRLSRHWARRHRVPYLDELAEVAGLLSRPGAWMLNLCFEWGCTTGIAVAPERRGMVMMRTLDWPLDGLGKQLVVSRQSGPAGPWFNVTWPGFVGVTTALAPGRFSGALNQAPMAKHGLGRIGDWAVNRWRLWRDGRVPPSLLLRRAFEECADFDAAVRLLTETPLALPAIYTLAGADPRNGVVIERLEAAAHVHRAPVCVTNHWLTPTLGGRPRSRRSRDRLDLMRARLAAAAEGMAWLDVPILNDTTRLAVTANAATGELTVQGFESGAPATSVLRLVA
jgi:hypothetical protein